jgi:GT2 family glycosyltransferase
MIDCSSPLALTLDAVIICFNRQKEVEGAIRSCRTTGINNIFVLDNASEPPIALDPDVHLQRSSKNLGVCGGRNAIAESSSADLLLFLDDDAELSEEIDLQEVIDEFTKDPNLSVTACLAKRENGQIAKHEFPGRKVQNIEQPRDVGYFVGCGFVIRRTVLINLKGFDESFFYAHEETDLSLRIANANGRIFYNPALKVIHKPSEKGRDFTTKDFSRQMRNRKILSWRSLPRPISYLHLCIWFIFYLTKSSPKKYFHLAKSVFKPLTMQEKAIGRSPLQFRRLNHLQKIGYRIYW